jgi:muramoyltetrapeptide carboxypeptidase
LALASNDVVYVRARTNTFIQLFEYQTMLQPSYLKPGDTVGIIAPARKVSEQEMQPTIKVFESWGLNVRLGKHLFGAHHQFSGAAAERAADLQEMIEMPEVKAIIGARGGYGCAQLLPLVNFSNLQASPKWIAGYSDITALHLSLAHIGVESIHATMPINFTDNTESVTHLRKALFGENLTYSIDSHPFNIPKKATGILTGGNLSIICSLQGTPHALLPKNAILFIEDIDEYLYHIDRMMMNLFLSGALQQVKGIVAGSMTDMKDNATPYGKSAYEIIHEHAQNLGIPVCFGFPAGHQKPNLPLIFGREVKLIVTNNSSMLEFCANT